MLNRTATVLEHKKFVETFFTKRYRSNTQQALRDQEQHGFSPFEVRVEAQPKHKHLVQSILLFEE